MRMTGRRALVTGGASGIGKATVALLRNEGADVFDADLSYPPETLAGEHGGPIHLDVADEAQWQRLADRTGRIDALVACAGISAAAPIDATSLPDWRRVMSVNLDGAFLSLKYGARCMRPGGGTMVVIGSASGVKAVAQAAAYCASKAAVRMLVRVAALELKSESIRVNCISPAGVVTPMWSKMAFWQDLVREHGSEEGAWNALGGADPDRPSLERMALPEEIAEAAVFLSCSQSAHITGVDLAVDGGYTA
jgi:2-keto-3-deoxy-L-fuconate dehydrogenase